MTVSDMLKDGVLILCLSVANSTVPDDVLPLRQPGAVVAPVPVHGGDEFMAEKVAKLVHLL